MRRLTKVTGLFLALALITGCAAGRAFQSGEERARVGDWDSAVTYYRTAVQADPDKPEYRIALERAMLNASRFHFDNARALEAKDQLDAALLEYRRTVEFDPGNTQALDRVVQLEKIIRDRIEASRPKPAIVQLREQARQVSPAPLLNPASRAPLDYNFKQASLRDVLTFIGSATGINIIYDVSFNDRPVTATLQGSIEQVLNTLLSSNALFFTVLDERTIVVAQDSAPNRLKYERQVALTMPLSYADATEIAAMLTAITRTTTGVTIPPVIIPNKTNNSITVRATEPVIAVIRELVLTNDKPRAEITLDVEILEVSRSRTKELGLNLTQNQIGGIFSPEQAPPAVGTTDNQPFNLNTITQGVSTADFYLTVPQAIVKFLQSDVNTRFLAQTQLRGSEGAQLSLKVGADEPYLTTSFSPIAGGGANVNPLSSYTFRTVGISVQATPRLITDEGDILMDLTMSNDTLGPARLVGGQLAPSFPTRSVTTKLRLRDGESHLLAGLLQDDERRSMTGFPGIMSIPVLKSIFSASDDVIAQTDIVMLLTPRIIRTHEYTARDLSPIYVGTNQNFGLTGPPPLIAPPAATPETAPTPGAATPGAAAPAPSVPPQGLPVPTAPQGGTPGQVTVSDAQAPAQPPAAPQPQGLAAPPADPQVQRDLTAPSPTALAPPAQVSVTAPVGEVRVGAGPYLVPIYVSSVSRASTITLTVTYNPAVLRMRTVQEGSFLRQGGATAVFTPNTDAAVGRVDLAFVRTGDKVGASGSGLLAALQFDAIGSGSSQLTISGVLANPNGGTIQAQFVPATVVVR